MPPMKILVADKLDPAALSALKQAGFEILAAKGLAPETLPAGAAEAAILVVRSTPVTAALLPLFPALGLIVRAGSGVDTIDVSAAAARGIQVANCPGRNA